MANIWEWSAQRTCYTGKITMHETAHIISLISLLKLSSRSNQSNSDPTSSILNDHETCFVSGMEWDHPLLRQEIFKSSARKFWLNGLCPDECFSIHKLSPCGPVTGGNFPTTARSSHLFASKVVFEERKWISSTMGFKFIKYERST